MKKVLHVGCGGMEMPDFLDGYKEVRLDIDPSCNPDIVASMTDMGDIGEFDAVYGCHVLEHFFPHEVKTVLSECKRVLKENGFLMMVVPNLEDVRPTDEPLYESDAGWITGLDMIYGKDSLIQKSIYMAHKTGFVPYTLRKSIEEAGFNYVQTRDLTKFNLLGTGVKKCNT